MHRDMAQPFADDTVEPQVVVLGHQSVPAPVLLRPPGRAHRDRAQINGRIRGRQRRHDRHTATSRTKWSAPRSPHAGRRADKKRALLEGVVKRYDEIQVVHGLDLDVDVDEREFCVFVGPSDCGKSTLLRMVAGLEETTSGRIRIGAWDVTDEDPARRGVAMVFQTYALYPHMTVEQNMSFGLRMNGHPSAEIRERVAEASRILRLQDYLRRKPKALSGGQRQRVAIGRAIVRGPEVFLFDEPLSNLDAELRVEMRVEIARLHQEIGATMIYVTHDQVEAMTLADKIVVLREGRIEQVGAPMDLYRDPDNRFVAGFIGSPAMNFLDATVAAQGVDVPALRSDVRPDVSLPRAGTPVSLGLRPEHISIDAAGKTHRVELTEALGGVSYAYLESVTGERLIVEERGDDRVAAGETIGLSFESRHLRLFDADSGLRIR